MDNNFFDTILEDNVKLSPKLLNKNYVKHIKEILKRKYEGICSRHGYIKKNSIEIVKTGTGKIETHSFHGYVIFNVTYQAKVCNPTVGSIIKCKVKNMNDFGILCDAGIIENGVYTHVIDIIILKNSNNINTNIELVKNIKLDDTVFVEIIGKKYNLNNKRISAIGKIENSHQNKVSLDKEQVTSSQLEEDTNDDDELVEDESEKEEDEDDENEDEEYEEQQDENEEDEEFDDDGDDDNVENSEEESDEDI